MQSQALGQVGRAGPAGRTRSLFILSAIAFLLGVATVLSLFSPTHWLLDLLANFPMHMACAQILVALGLIALRAYGRAFLFLVPLPLLVMRLVPLFEARSVPPHTEATLRVLTFNVHVTSDAHTAVLALIEQSRADVVVLEEISPRWERALSEVKAPYRLACVSDRLAGRGVALISRIPVKRCETISGPARVPALRAVADWNGQEIVVMGVHAPPPMVEVWATSRDALLAELSERARAEPLPVIIAGDLNATPFSSAFSALTEASGLQSSHLGFGWQPSFPSYAWSFGVPIDHLLHSSSFLVLERETGPASGSNHRPVVVTLARAR